MNGDELPTYNFERVTGESWVGCLKKGTLEIWFGGGPGCGRLASTYSNKQSASAAVKIALDEVGQKTLSRARQSLTAQAEQGKLPDVSVDEDNRFVDATEAVAVLRVCQSGVFVCFIEENLSENGPMRLFGPDNDKLLAYEKARLAVKQAVADRFTSPTSLPPTKIF